MASEARGARWSGAPRAAPASGRRRGATRAAGAATGARRAGVPHPRALWIGEHRLCVMCRVAT
eukprot:9380426-Pyramimonas_sp.AAC.1